MGNPDTLTIGAQKTIAQSHCLIGAKRMLAAFEAVNAARFEAIYEQVIVDYIKAHPEYPVISVLMSGDVGFYSGAKKLAQGLAGYDTEFICGISSVVYFCAKLKTAWDDVHLVSAHGRACNVLAEVTAHPKVFILTGGKETVATICQALCANGLSGVTVQVGERLSYEDETITSGTAAELQNRAFASLSVMLIQNPNCLQGNVVTHGLPDEAFVRGDVPMTKSEVRSISLSKLLLKADDVVYDIGAGTGSVSIEMALQARRGMVYAIEKNETAIALLEQNKTKFRVANLRIITGKAPEALTDLPAPDAAFIGGSAGQMERIFEILLKKNPNVKIVVNAIAIETLSETMACMRQFNMEDVDITQAAISKTRAVGQYHMMTGQNPIFIISGRGRGHEQQ